MVSKVPATVEKVPRAVGGPRIAIILDDAGASFLNYKDIFSIDVPFTLSVLPNLPWSERVVKEAIFYKKEALLHLPMEPENQAYVRTDGGMVLVSMGDIEIENVVVRDLSTVAGVVGVNNHMGSRATLDRRVVDAVFKVLRDKGLFFVDSRTGKGSIAYKAAKEDGLAAEKNSVFLDVVDSTEAIEMKLRELISIGRARGSAVGIAHATRPVTIAVLKKLLPEYAKEGVNFVVVSSLMRNDRALKP